MGQGYGGGSDMRWASAVSIVVAWLAAVAPAQAQCELSMTIDGDPVLVSAMRAALSERGVGLDDPHCSAAESSSLTVTRTAAGGVRLELHAPDGSNASRDVDRVTTAAMLVESWTEATRLDLLEPPLVRAASADTATSEPTEPPTLVPDPPTPSTLVTLTAHGIFAVGDEGSTWFGAQIGACAHAGPACIGANVRYLSDGGLSDGTVSEGGSRTYLGGDLELSLPFAPSAFITLTPAIALGLGWMDMVVLDGGRTVVVDGLRAMVSGSFAGAVALVDWLSLELRIAVSWSPLARQSSWMSEGASFDPDPVVLGSVLLGLRADLR